MHRADPSRSFVAAAFALVAFAACTPAFGQDDSRQRELVLEATFDVAGKNLLIDIDDADVVVRNGNTDEVTFEVWFTARNLPEARRRVERMNFRAAADDNTISLRSDAVDNNWDGWDWRRWGGYDLVVEATVPENIDARVVAADGDISVQRLHGAITVLSEDGDISADALVGVVRLETEDGDVIVRSIAGPSLNIRSEDGDISLGDLDSGKIEIHTTDGDIHGTRVAGTSIDAQTDDGDIIVDAVSGPFRARTEDGDIHVSFEQLGETALQTGEGDITIRATETLSAKLDLRGYDLSMRSEIRSAFDGRVERRIIEGSLNGGGPTLQARTGEGTIVLRLISN
jgi:hypothetical protein